MIGMASIETRMRVNKRESKQTSERENKKESKQKEVSMGTNVGLDQVSIASLC